MAFRARAMITCMTEAAIWIRARRVEPQPMAWHVRGGLHAYSVRPKKRSITRNVPAAQARSIRGYRMRQCAHLHLVFGDIDEAVA